MDDLVVPLLDRSGEWTHRERHQHHLFEIHVPDGTTELRLRFRWGPLDLGSEHLGNGVSLSLFGPDGFRGSAMRSYWANCCCCERTPSTVPLRGACWAD